MDNNNSYSKVFRTFVCVLFLYHTIFEQILPSAVLLPPFSILLSVYISRTLIYYYKNTTNAENRNNAIRYIVLTIFFFYYYGFTYRFGSFDYSIFKNNNLNTGIYEYIFYYSLALFQLYILIIGRKYFKKIILRTLFFLLVTLISYCGFDYLLNNEIDRYYILIFKFNFYLTRFYIDMIFIVYSYKKYTELYKANSN